MKIIFILKLYRIFKLKEHSEQNIEVNQERHSSIRAWYKKYKYRNMQFFLYIHDIHDNASFTAIYCEWGSYSSTLAGTTFFCGDH